MKYLFTITPRVAIFLFIFSGISLAADPIPNAIVTLTYGANQVDLDGDGIDDLILLARRENFNAHGFDVASFYFQLRTRDKATKPWNIVPLFKDGKESLTVNSSGGADCLLRDFRLLRPDQNAKGMLIVATRKTSSSFYEENSVEFDYYTLVKNRAAEIGRPFLYFNHQKTVETKKKYCDVNAAFREELGLRHYLPGND